MNETYCFAIIRLCAGRLIYFVFIDNQARGFFKSQDERLRPVLIGKVDTNSKALGNFVRTVHLQTL